MPETSTLLAARLAAESAWADQLVRGWCCVKHAALLGALVLALVGCQSAGQADDDGLRWQAARLVKVLEANSPEAANVAKLCGDGAVVKVGYYRGGTRFYQVRPHGDATALVGQSVRFDRMDPCGAVEPTADR